MEGIGLVPVQIGRKDVIDAVMVQEAVPPRSGCIGLKGPRLHPFWSKKESWSSVQGRLYAPYSGGEKIRRRTRRRFSGFGTWRSNQA